MIKIQIIDDIRAQTFEFMMVVGFSLIITISLVISFADSNELNQAMTASRTGIRWFYFDGLAIPYGRL